MGEVLDFVGGEEELGKPTGQDLREGACDAWQALLRSYETDIP